MNVRGEEHASGIYEGDLVDVNWEGPDRVILTIKDGPKERDIVLTGRVHVHARAGTDSVELRELGTFHVQVYTIRNTGRDKTRDAA